MRNFRRKLARLFGLALRSDLEKVNEAYKKRDKEATAMFSKYMCLRIENSDEGGFIEGCNGTRLKLGKNIQMPSIKAAMGGSTKTICHD